MKGVPAALSLGEETLPSCWRSNGDTAEAKHGGAHSFRIIVMMVLNGIIIIIIITPLTLYV